MDKAGVTAAVRPVSPSASPIPGIKALARCSLGGSFEKTRTCGGSVQDSTLNFDNVIARAAVSNLTAAQVAQRQRSMMSSQVQRVDAAFNESTPSTSTGASGSGAVSSAWLYGVGTQFAVDSSGLSGEQRMVKCGKQVHKLKVG
ncbi:hypothetical protein J7T55_003690 [Diaporthe amygdali]|uniref:uncharacterized protein n=1 Tax=Phomopsis amygdali TaxID=1214568 RepID=UPI0022FF0DF1|nr:uncharacterized protein J7T55_003690 [Diaporthe amygdali]KAJ0117279.1 hypothetical protein J7T55_003690 [Diaporthe amygdali]